MNVCNQETRLTQFLLGDLPESEKAALHEHLATCAVCLKSARRIEPVVAALHRVMARDAALRPQFTPARRASMLNIRPQARSILPFFRWMQKCRPFLDVAACLAIVLGLMWAALRPVALAYRVPRGKGAGAPVSGMTFAPATAPGEACELEARGEGFCNANGTVVQREMIKPIDINMFGAVGEPDTEKRPEIQMSTSRIDIKEPIDIQGQTLDLGLTVKANTEMAKVLLDKEEYPEANEYLEKALAQEPNSVDAQILKGKVHLKMKKLIEATYIPLGGDGLECATESPPPADVPTSRADALKSEALGATVNGSIDRVENAKTAPPPASGPLMLGYGGRAIGGVARVEPKVSAARSIAMPKGQSAADAVNAAHQALQEMGVQAGGEVDTEAVDIDTRPVASFDGRGGSIDVGGTAVNKKYKAPAPDTSIARAGQAAPEVKQPSRVVTKNVILKMKKVKHKPVNSSSMPDLEDSKLAADVDGESSATYVADPSRFMSRLGTGKAGKLGSGGGGTGGWPDGMENLAIRLIRMQYDGAGWDDGMDETSRADLNFLDTFHQLTGFKVATKPESHPIKLLRKYPKGYAPPFVFMTGAGDISVPDRDVKALREYLLDGGMLFADCSSPQWGQSFKKFMGQVFPDQALQPLADDDPLFQVPYSFPNGAPPFWHHAGVRVQGIKHDGRWLVYLHPGAVHDAWKTGHSGMDPNMAEDATRVGVNVVYYAFTHYLEKTRKYRDGGSETPAPPTVVADPVTPAPVVTAPPKPAAPPPPKPAPKPRVPGAHNPFVATETEPFSTFAIDVDTASYTLTRQAIRAGQLPDPEVVRTEEIVNAFDYNDAPPDNATFRVYVEGAPSPYGQDLTLLRIGVKGRRLGREEQRPAMLTFLIDTSGSMMQPDRIGLARTALKMLLANLSPVDRIQIVSFDDHARIVLDPTPAAEAKKILAVFDALQCTGSTNLEDGMRKAYERAARAFTPGAENRVVIISDGVANLGTDEAPDILAKVESFRRQGITCSVFGVGQGTYNDQMLEQLANKGDGVYRFLDSEDEARRVFVDDLAATLHTIATDVKIQVEWNAAAVQRYRQLGYENRALTKQQFRDDTVDAGEVGSGQAVTALYELAPTAAASRLRLGTVRVRYRRTDTHAIEEIATPILPSALSRSLKNTRPQFQLAACAAEFSEILRVSPYAAGSRFEDVARLLRPVAMALPLDARVSELLQLTEQAESLNK